MYKEQRANGKFTYQNIAGDSAGGWAGYFQQIRYAVAPTLACHEVRSQAGHDNQPVAPGNSVFDEVAAMTHDVA
jgi:hypothetical protein